VIFLIVTMESAPKKCDVLVVDSAGFIKNAKLEQISSEIVTVRAVVSEIRDRAAKERLQVTPYEIMFKEPDQEDMKHGR
jgi:RNA-binding protein NOB1